MQISHDPTRGKELVSGGICRHLDFLHSSCQNGGYLALVCTNLIHFFDVILDILPYVIAILLIFQVLGWKRSHCRAKKRPQVLCSIGSMIISSSVSYMKAREVVRALFFVVLLSVIGKFMAELQVII